MNIKDLTKIHDWLWEIPRSARKDMRVPARVYASEKMLGDIFEDRSLEQLMNLATLPGIEKYSLAMPDVHEGYGAPIGGVFAVNLKNGIISPGAVGYDLNCGIRLLRTEKFLPEIKPYLDELAQAIYREVPSGVGRGGRIVMKGKDLDNVLQKGARQMVEMEFGQESDLEHIESKGMIKEADASLVSDKAKKRGQDQLGTLGAGNHFIEVEVADKIFDEQEAKKLNIAKDQVVVFIHTGSRGLGHQIATDYIRMLMQSKDKYKISLPDRELIYAPFNSVDGQKYFKAMAAGANFAWANRQLIMQEVRKAWENVLGESGGKLNIIYDVAHNIAKVEEHDIDGKKCKVVVHRKGATRAFPGQPVLIPGSMGTGSHLLVGQEKAMSESFGSSCHGAGRRMSRSQAKRIVQGPELKERLKSMGIAIQAGSFRGLAEEAPEAYKDVDEVVEVVHKAGIAKKVVKFKPVAVVKG